jgi:hypothetical protein
VITPEVTPWSPEPAAGQGFLFVDDDGPSGDRGRRTLVHIGPARTPGACSRSTGLGARSECNPYRGAV